MRNIYFILNLLWDLSSHSLCQHLLLWHNSESYLTLFQRNLCQKRIFFYILAQESISGHCSKIFKKGIIYVLKLAGLFLGLSFASCHGYHEITAVQYSKYTIQSYWETKLISSPLCPFLKWILLFTYQICYFLHIRRHS